jgi:copper resistance protein C
MTTSMAYNFSRIAVVVALGLGLSGWAQAHAHLLTSTPAADATTAAPAELDLKFSEGLSLRFSGATLHGPDGATVATGTAHLASDDDTLLVVPVPGPLAAGAYTVEWHALSNDGHKTQGRYGFNVAGRP